MKRKFLIGFVSLFLMVHGMYANMPVLDVTNLAQAIQQVYQQYQQIQQTIEQVQNTYTQIEQAAKQVTAMDWNSLADLSSNFSGMSVNPVEYVTKVKSSAQQISQGVQDNLNAINNVKDSLTSQTISLGGVDVSVADLVGAGDTGNNILGFAQNAWNYAAGEIDEDGNLTGPFAKAIEQWVKSLTTEQRKKIYQKYGMDARRWATLQFGEYQLNNIMTEGNVKGTLDFAKDLLGKAMGVGETMKKASQNLPDGSITAGIEVVNNALANSYEKLGDLEGSINNIFGFLSSKLKSEKTETALKQQQAAEVKEAVESVEKGNGTSIIDTNL